MLGQRFLSTSYQKHLQQTDYDKHKKKLQEIRSVDRKRQIQSKSSASWKTSNQHFKHLQFVANEKYVALDKENKALLEKLVHISKTPKPLFNSTATESFIHSKTLNSPYRKKELERIALENEAMAKRLISSNGTVNRQVQKVEFKKHKELLHLVQKMAPAVKGYEKVEALSSPKSEDTQKAFKIRTKKISQMQKSISEGADKKIQETNEAREEATSKQENTEEAVSPNEKHATERNEEAKVEEEKPIEPTQNVPEKSEEAVQRSEQNASQAKKEQAEPERAENNTKREPEKEAETEVQQPSQTGVAENGVAEKQDALLSIPKEGEKSESPSLKSARKTVQENNVQPSSRKVSQNLTVTKVDENPRKSSCRESALSLERTSPEKVGKEASQQAISEKQDTKRKETKTEVAEKEQSQAQPSQQNLQASQQNVDARQSAEPVNKSQANVSRNITPVSKQNITPQPN